MIGVLGLGILLNLVITCIFALLAETLLLYWRRVAIKPFITDGSALLTAWLLALSLPPYVPWWIPAIAVTAAIIIGKQIYGGLGNNLFNPAMVGYALILIAFPNYLTVWPGAELIQQRFTMTTVLNIAFTSMDMTDMMSGATALDTWRASRMLGDTNPATLNWHWISGAFLLGGAWLIGQRIILWQIPTAMLTTIAIGALLASWFGDASPVGTVSVVFHLFNGATMLGAFFIATDPVTAPRAKSAMLLFGAGVGLLLLLFRFNSTFIDGLAFSILLMNMTAPLLDQFFSRIKS